jgi:hypothetical protein
MPSPAEDTAAPTTITAAPASPVTHLRRLYLVRFVFAAAWAGAFAALGSSLNAASITLLVLYPAFDVAAACVDVRTSQLPFLRLNIAISSIATVGLAIAAADDIPAVLRSWGAWAILAGLVQFIVALRRRTLGGQWAMILSGGISVIAGASFFVQAGNVTSLTRCAGYAGLGALFFLASALRRPRVAH